MTDLKADMYPPFLSSALLLLIWLSICYALFKARTYMFVEAIASASISGTTHGKCNRRISVMGVIR